MQCHFAFSLYFTAVFDFVSNFFCISACGAPGSKRLSAASTSSTFQWTGEAVKKMAGQGSLYLMADHDLRVPVPNNSISFEV
jgi:hypothetical protein